MATVPETSVAGGRQGTPRSSLGWHLRHVPGRYRGLHCSASRLHPTPGPRCHAPRRAIRRARGTRPAAGRRRAGQEHDRRDPRGAPQGRFGTRYDAAGVARNVADDVAPPERLVSRCPSGRSRNCGRSSCTSVRTGFTRPGCSSLPRACAGVKSAASPGQILTSTPAQHASSGLSAMYAASRPGSPD